MLNYEKTGLVIFDNFHIDFNLPKWENRKQDSTVPDYEPSGRFISTERGKSLAFIPTNSIAMGGTISGDSNEKKANWFDKLFGTDKKRRKLEEERIATEMQSTNFSVDIDETQKETIEITPKEFFDSIKGSAETLSLANERFANYENAIKHLKRTGQIAMIERMQYDLAIHVAETKLYAIGYRKIISEKNVIEFANKVSKNVRIDWIKNFARLVPEKILDAKEECDKHSIFDNYVIMHYDPYNDGRLETLEDKTKRELKEKDPILFGVILGSNKLYYLGDWIDEYCDLTFDKLVETLGEDAISANDLSVDIKTNRV